MRNKKMLKTQEPQILEESKEYPVLATVNGIQIVKYSEKSVAAIGETKAFKDAIKEVGGKWNPKLKCGPGWILSAKKLEDLKTALSSTPTDPSPTLVRKVVRRKKVKVKVDELTLVKNEVVKVLHSEPSVSQLTRIETKLDMILTLLGTMGVSPSEPSEPPPPVPTKPADIVEPVVKKTRKKVVKRRKKIKKSDQVPPPAITKTTEHVDQKPRKKLLGK
jgi:hypothetical protein